MIRCLIFDIEGTTTSVNFVFEVLFPYFRQNVQKLRDRINDPAITSILSQVQTMVQEEDGLEIDLLGAIERLHQWSVEDRKVAPLKTLQGLLWEEGYRTGAFRGHIYEDVPRNLNQWQQLGLTMGIYSSGSAYAQKLLFSHSEFGDLTPYFDWYFDLTLGQKRASTSYEAIAQTINIDPSAILFLSDVPEELNAAQTVGFKVLQLVRPGTTPSDRHPKVNNFDQIELNAL
ncbi:MAG: acireductone synthase [Synechococcaceae cyanobacterium RL_1_2]|nr:acireductone synthase [Synechococcaceae cyanobacterium RL_1_2]